MAYKQDAAAPFRDVTRQLLFSDPRLDCEWRYFEVAAGGYSTLERHDHVHARDDPSRQGAMSGRLARIDDV